MLAALGHSEEHRGLKELISRFVHAVVCHQKEGA